MNYMKQVAEMLGVEMGERFNIKGFGGDYCFTNDGIEDVRIEKVVHSGILQRLLDGSSEVIKKPWKPIEAETYWYIRPNGDISFDIWHGLVYECAMLYMGNCFRGEKEAKVHKDEIMTKFKAVMEE